MVWSWYNSQGIAIVLLESVSNLLTCNCCFFHPFLICLQFSPNHSLHYSSWALGKFVIFWYQQLIKLSKIRLLETNFLRWQYRRMSTSHFDISAESFVICIRLGYSFARTYKMICWNCHQSFKRISQLFVDSRVFHFSYGWFTSLGESNYRCKTRDEIGNSWWSGNRE